MLYVRAVVRTAAAVLCLFMTLHAECSSAQATKAFERALERGTWQALMLAPGGELGRADLEVSGGGASTRAFMKWRGGIIEVTELNLSGGILSFTWEPSFYLTCRLERQATGQYKGSCLDSQKFVGPMVLSPPGVPAEEDDIDLDKAFEIWEISRDDYIREHYPQPNQRVDFEEPPGVPTRLVTVDGRNVNVAVAGEGDVTVVLISGTGDDHTVWQRAQLALSDGMRTLSYDRPGLGRSEDLEGAATPAQMADGLRAILRQSAVQPPYVLVGHGAASFVVREFTERYGGDVAGIVLIDPAHEREDDVWKALDAASWEEYVQRRRNFLAAVSPASAREFDGYLNALKTWDERVEEAELEVPAVVLAGGQPEEAADWIGGKREGREARIRLQRDLAEAMGADFRKADGGRYVHLEDPRTIVNAVERVLKAR